MEHQHHQHHRPEEKNSGHQQNRQQGGSHDHHDHHRHMIRDFRRRFWVGLVLTVPILLLSPMIQNWLGISWQIPG